MLHSFDRYLAIANNCFSSTKQQSKRESDLDIIRGVAIVLALGWHFNSGTGLFWFDCLEYPGMTFGWAGVDLFFVLSGFLIGRLVFKEIVRTKRFDYKRFIIRRALRLWPTLYLFLLVQFFWGDHDWHTYLIQTLFHVQNYFDSPLLHLWSLSIEEHFYLIFGVLCYFYAFRISHNKMTPIILIALLIICPVIRYLAFASGWSARDIQQQTQFRFDALSAGVLMAYLFVYQEELFVGLLRFKWLWFALTIGGCICLTYTSLESPEDGVFMYTVAWITSASFIMLTYRTDLVKRIPILSRLLIFLGVYSYSLYIWQFSGRHAAAYIQSHFTSLGGHATKIVLQYVTATCVAFAISRLIEKPMIALRDRMFVKPND